MLVFHDSGDKSKPSIMVLMGGMSAEHPVSIMSGNVVSEHLIEMGYNVTAIDMGNDITDYIKQLKPDLIFNALHGPFGEDGCVPGMLEIMGVPYTHSGVLASALALNKIISQNIFLMSGIKCPKRKIVNKNNNHVKDPFPRPYIIKPVNEGSSIGIVAVFEGDEFSMLDYDFAHGDDAIVEEFVEGKEIQIAVVGGKAIGSLEIVPLKSRFYDYETKYTDGMAEHLYPARLSEKNIKKAYEISEKAHHLIGCKGVSRVEFRYDEKNDELYFLELNTHPGFTPLSIVPEIAMKNGISFNNLLQILIDEAMYEDLREKI